MVQPINKMQANGDSAAPGYSPTRVMTIGEMAWERKGAGMQEVMSRGLRGGILEDERASFRT